jgi:N-acetylmuramoyl-L-alanine amidase
MAFKLVLGTAFLAFMGLAPLAVTAASAPARLDAVRMETAGEGLRLHLDLSRQAAHQFFTLDSPRRAVIDLTTTRAAERLQLPGAAGPIKALRTGPRPQQGLRLVVELDAATPVRVRPATGRAGYVLEIGAVGNRGTVMGSPPATSPTAPPPAPPTAAPPVDAEPVRAVHAVHAPPESGRDVIVAIDAGHGGVDPGAIGKGGTREKDVVLHIARDLAARINREPGMRAVLIRDGDYFLAHRQRMAKARAAKADMFVSVHADSVGNATVSGSSVYILSTKGASDEQARWLAERENAADLKGGISLDDKDNTLASVLLDLSQSASITSSMHAAERVLRTLNTVNEVRKPKVQQAGFLVLKSPDIPSMLVETAFISNPGDERRLRQEGYREKLAEAIFRGVHDYFADFPPEGTLFAARRRASDPPTARNLP